jgi:hypothetical protein
MYPSPQGLPTVYSFEEMMNMISQMPITIWEVFMLDENGEIIDHTPENHRELTFKNDVTGVILKVKELEEQGIKCEVWQLGPIDPITLLPTGKSD